ncbi:hypothetical protein FDECE_799 [Fusarium decemcellulare]|nr:hypothetical protein FDECE_799 [Fusarium decemcellulare]
MENLFTTVGLVPKLKPEVRLAQAVSEFHASLSTENDRIKFKNLQSQSPPGSDEIIKLTEEINRDGARLHRSWRPYGTRLVAILDRIRQFAPIGDVLVGGSQNLIACGVWAAIRLSLETSLTFLSYFENVTALMLRIGRSLSLHQDFSMLFPNCQQLQTYMCEYTIVMVNICTKIVANCGKTVLSQLASSLVSSFDAAYKPLESDLATWGHMIEKRTTVLLAQSNLQSQATVLERFNRLQATASRERAKIQREDRKHRLLGALCPIQDEVNLIWRRERKKGTSTWINNHAAYQDWLRSESSSMLWLTGNLGSGKTVTMASVVANLISSPLNMNRKDSCTISYFFCQSGNPKTLLASALLGSIVAQALDSPTLEPSLTPFLEETEISPNICARIEDYVDVLFKATPPNWRGIFVLDGIDECSLVEAEEVFSQLKKLSRLRRVHILFSSRPTSPSYGAAQSILNVSATLSMETVDRSDDIRAYITAEIAHWSEIRQLPSELERLAEEQLLAGCQGMFLWLSLQVEDICPKYTQDLRPDVEILTILENLPKSLPEAFDRALTRIQDGKFGSNIFKLVAAAERTLTADELRVAASVEPGDKVWHSSKLINSGKTLLSRYGGSLLDIDEEDSGVRFIHYSVLLHLTGAAVDQKAAVFHFDLPEAQNLMGSVCVTYLNYSVFENRLSTAQKVSFGQVPEKTVESVAPKRLSRRVLTMLSRHSRQTSIKVDLEKLSYDLHNQKWEEGSDVHLFLDYARDHWLAATKHILGHVDHSVILLWKSLITGSTVSASLPWDAGVVSKAATWAIRNNHRSIFQFYLLSDSPEHVFDVLTAAEICAVNQPSEFLLSGEDLGLLAPLYLVSARKQVLALKAFIDLGCQPLGLEGSKLAWDPKEAHSKLIKSVRSTIVKAFQVSRHNDDVASAVVPFLFSYLSGPNEVLDNGLTILHTCIQFRHATLASSFLKMGADVNGNQLGGKPSPLQLSLKNHLVELARTLIQAGADVSATPDGYLPPILLALQSPDTGLFYDIFSQGAHERNRKYKYGLKTDTAFQYACRLFWRDSFPHTGYAHTVLKEMAKDGADINLRDMEGESPLILSTKMRNNWLTGTLLDLGADPNVTTPGGLSPLMVAAHHGDLAVVQRLLDSGADPNLRLAEGISTHDAQILDNTEGSTRMTFDLADYHGSEPTATGWSALTLSLISVTRALGKVKKAEEKLQVGESTNAGEDRNARSAYRNFAALSSQCRTWASIVKLLLERGAQCLPRDEQVASLRRIDRVVPEADCDAIMALLGNQGVRMSWR